MHKSQIIKEKMDRMCNQTFKILPPLIINKFNKIWNSKLSKLSKR